MSTNESIEQDLIDSLIRAIRVITTANGYSINLESNAVGDEFYPFELALYDHYVIVLPDTSEPEDRTNRCTKNVFTWTILVGVKPLGNTKSKNDRYKLLSYVRDAIMAQGERDDGTGKMLATLTRIDKTTWDVASNEEGTYYLAEITGHCNTHHKVTNYTNQ